MSSLVIAQSPSFLQTIRFGVGQVYENVGFVPLHSTSSFIPHTCSYLLVSTALQQGLLIVQETSTVQQLQVESRTQQPIFMPAGFRLIGGGQDRIVVASLILAPEATGPIATRCIERDRWNPTRGQHFHSAGDSVIAPSSVAAGSTRVQQADTWASITSLIDATGSETSTSRLADVHDQTAHGRAQYTQSFSLPPEPIVGAVFGLRRGAQHHLSVSLDIFGTEDLARELFPSLLDSVVIDAIAASRPGHAQVMNDHELLAAIQEAWTSIATATLASENVPSNRGVLQSGNGPRGEYIAILTDQGQPVHVRLRRV